MPRVNRDLQRRIAARRERERRRPTERRYTFTTTEPAVESDADAVVEQNGQATDATEEVEGSATAQRASGTPAASTRAATRPAYKPFSAYKDEYAYVYSDLRRVAAVFGGLLIGLLVLYFVLPLLVR
jgi:hypothetical protein